jgi:hypothetical protein
MAPSLRAIFSLNRSIQMAAKDSAGSVGLPNVTGRLRAFYARRAPASDRFCKNGASKLTHVTCLFATR